MLKPLHDPYSNSLSATDMWCDLEPTMPLSLDFSIYKINGSSFFNSTIISLTGREKAEYIILRFHAMYNFIMKTILY